MIFDAALCERAGHAASQRMLQRKPAWVDGNISPPDQPLLIGLVRLSQPRKVVEIGVASGWSGALLVDALENNGLPAQYWGIDTAERYYLDPAYATGAAIAELCPPGVVERHLLLGRPAAQAAADVGAGVDLAFIDGDHHHPWALLDLLALLPVLAPESLVLMHDLHLSTYERHRHANRGPKYLYECWPLQKLHSLQVLPMIGALVMPERFDDAPLTLLLDTACTPWEAAVPTAVLDSIATGLATSVGAAWAARFAEVFRQCNLAAQRQPGPLGAAELAAACVRRAESQKDPARIEADMAHVVALFPELPQVWHKWAVAQKAVGQQALALQSSTEAVSRHERAPHALSFHGQLLLENQRPAEAEDFMRRAIGLEPGQATFHHRLALLLLSQGRELEALQPAREALRLAPERPTIQELVGLLQARCESRGA